MTRDVLHITSVEPVIPGVLKLAWEDGYEEIVDLRGLIADGEIFAHIRNPDNFRQVRLETYVHHAYWGEEGDEIVDLGCDRLRDLAEKQAASKGMERPAEREEAEAGEMMSKDPFQRIRNVEPLPDLVLRLTFDDGWSGTVDLAPVIAKGGIFAFMADPAAFATVQIGEQGRSLLWLDPQCDEVDFCADALRMQAETRAVEEMAARAAP